VSEHTPDDLSDALVELGRVVAAHGLKGWVKVQPYSTQATVLLSAKTWWLAQPVAVLAARWQGNAVVAQLQGVADRDQAEALRGQVVRAPRSAFPAPEIDEYYWVDLVGCLLYGETAESTSALLGRVSAVSDNGAHALLTVVRLSPTLESVLDAKGRAREVLVPFVAAHVQRVDLAARRIDSNWPVDF